MLTFSRSAANEFKKRLIELYGNAANYVDIKTFHSYCFDLLGKVGTIEKSDTIIKEAVAKIRNGEVEPSQITKTVMVIDEAQDMDADEYELIKCLMEYNEDMRVIAVGDDDQNIYEFRGSSPEYMKRLIREYNAAVYELVENFRSKANLVNFTNRFSNRIKNRLKKIPIQPVQKDNGLIRLFKYKSENLIEPVVNDIVTYNLSGSTCILTRENNEALQITGLLLNNGMPAKLIRSNEGFNLYNLLETRYFINQLNMGGKACAISEEVWEYAGRKLKEQFGKCANYEIIKNIIKEFELTHKKTKYKSDLEIFIRESNLEDFYNEKTDTILVSTMHKAKGREFDNVFIMLDGFRPEKDEDIRLLYVAMTRAKKNLTIHYNGCYLDFINTENVVRVNDDNVYLPPCQLALQLSHKDVHLDFFMSCQHEITKLFSGDELAVNGEYCFNAEGHAVLRFSKQGINKIMSVIEKNYMLKSAKISFIVYWKKENTDNEIQIILPELYFERLSEGRFF